MATQATDIGLTSRRLISLIPLAVGLVSLVTGRRALGVIKRNGKSGIPWSVTTLALGSLALILSALHLYSSGNMGTGSGRLGALVAMVVSLVGVVFGCMAINRLNKRDDARS